jgi:hypothetical protein
MEWSGRAPARSKRCCTKGKEHAMVETLKNSIAFSASISARIRSISSGLDEHGTIVLREPIDAAKRAATYWHVSTGSQFANDARIPSQPPTATLDEIVLTNLQRRVPAPEIMRLMNVG